ncbi:MAG: Hpt domain-containing protein [Bdellovibrio sp.]
MKIKPIFTVEKHDAHSIDTLTNLKNRDFEHHVEEYFMGKFSIFEGVAKSFLNHYQVTLKSLEDAVKAENAKEIYFFSHGLKGSVAIFQNQSSMKLLLELEQAAKAGDISNAVEKFNKIKEEVFKLAEQILWFLEKRKSKVS